MSIGLWIIASVLSLGFISSGAVKIIRSREQVVGLGFGWAEHYSRPAVKLIGIAEVAGAVGLVVPPLAGIVPVLSPIAATCLALLMAGAVIVHLRRREGRKLAVPVALLLLASVVAVGRFAWCPF
ncbi:DoxX family protein [Microlunatus soli]|uniref:DoxX-like family protein n=1 Tax=Microlunatus soli TaxID=630515 RepID=A0A1H1YW29_9ACTN|nr:DoxX family protein [Microlunatus soli]SDT25630.1 DoxX-like family protein [Microlunatus soli]